MTQLCTSIIICLILGKCSNLCNYSVHQYCVIIFYWDVKKRLNNWSVVKIAFKKKCFSSSSIITRMPLLNHYVTVNPPICPLIWLTCFQYATPLVTNVLVGVCMCVSEWGVSVLSGIVQLMACHPTLRTRRGEARLTFATADILICHCWPSCFRQ